MGRWVSRKQELKLVKKKKINDQETLKIDNRINKYKFTEC